LGLLNTPVDIEKQFTLLFQRNETGSSQAMEYEGFQRCMEFLSNKELNMTTFVSDRHTSIQKHMREKLPKIIHYFDLWHIKKSEFSIISAGIIQEIFS
jgi:hypothetical protein